MSPADRARAAHAAAEAATHPADRAAFKAAAAAWEALGRPGQTWSHQPAERALAGLRRDLAQASEAPKAAPPAPVTLDALFAEEEATALKRWAARQTVTTIEF